MTGSSRKFTEQRVMKFGWEGSLGFQQPQAALHISSRRLEETIWLDYWQTERFLPALSWCLSLYKPNLAMVQCFLCLCSHNCRLIVHFKSPVVAALNEKFSFSEKSCFPKIFGQNCRYLPWGHGWRESVGGASCNAHFGGGVLEIFEF